MAKQNSSGDFEDYYTILQGFDSEDERISSLCKEIRKILLCSIFSYYEGCINAIIKYYKIETEAQQVQKLHDAISRTYEKRYLVNDPFWLSRKTWGRFLNEAYLRRTYLRERLLILAWRMQCTARTDAACQAGLFRMVTVYYYTYTITKKI